MNRKLVSLCALGTIALAPPMHAQAQNPLPRLKAGTRSIPYWGERALHSLAM